MAQYLLAFRANQRVTLPSDIVISSGDDFDFKLNVSPLVNADFVRPLGGGSVAVSRVLIFGNGNIRLSSSSGTNREWSTGLTLTDITSIRFTRVSGQLDLYVNDNLQSGGFASNSDGYNFSVIGANYQTTGQDFDFYGAQFEINAVLVHNYDPSASNGTGSTLIDTVSGNDGTLVNFPTDNSQWVKYATFDPTQFYIVDGTPAPIVIPESYTPSSATTGQTLVITEAVINQLSNSDDFWNNVEEDGGDIRLCSAGDGTEQLPLEIVSFDKVAKTCVIWTRKPSYTGTGSLYLFFGKAGETQPPVTDPFGRNAVWADATYVQSADGLTDATGATTITLTDATQVGTIKGFNSVQFPNQGNGSSASTARATFDATSGENWTGDFTVSAWVNADALTQNFAQIIGIRALSVWEFSFRLEGSQPAMLIGSSSPNSSGNLSVSTDQLLHATVSGTTISFFLDGSPIGTSTVTGSRSDLSQDITFGGMDGTGTGTTFAGRIAQARAMNGVVLPSAHIATEYNNQNDPATFFGTPTLASTGGGGVDVTIVLNSGNYSLSGTDVSILKNSFLATEIGSYLKDGQSLGLLSQRNLSIGLGEYNYSGNDLDILYNRSLPFDTGAYTKEGSNVDLVIDRFLSTESGSYVYTGEDINLSYSQALTLTLGTGSYTYQGTDQGLLKDFLLPVEAGNYTYESSNVTLLVDRVLPVQSGEYIKTGNSVNFVYETNGITYTLSLEEGSYLKQGTPLRMLANRLLPVDAGIYLYEGANSNLLYNRVVALDSGMYSSAGTDLGLRVNRRLQIENGNYSLTGTPITLSYTGEVLAILEGYSINYKQDAVNDCFYKQDILSIRYI